MVCRPAVSRSSRACLEHALVSVATAGLPHSSLHTRAKRQRAHCDTKTNNSIETVLTQLSDQRVRVHVHVQPEPTRMVHRASTESDRSLRLAFDLTRDPRTHACKATMHTAKPLQRCRTPSRHRHRTLTALVVHKQHGRAPHTAGRRVAWPHRALTEWLPQPRVMQIVTMPSTIISRSPNCTHELPRTVLLLVVQAIDVGRDPAGSCPMRPQQGAVAHA